MSPERFAKIKRVLDRRQPDLTVVMEDVHKPHNLAAISRTCDAVGVGEVHAVASDEEIVLRQKAAGGVAKWVAVHRHASIAEAYAVLRRRGLRLLTAHFDDRARDYRRVDFTRPTAIVVGAELEGISPAAVAAADGSIVIPMAGMVQSLNVSVAAALILFEAQRQREIAGLYDACRLPPEVHREQLFEWTHPRVAAYCRRKGLPYPALDAFGEIAEPLADRSAVAVEQGKASAMPA